MKINDQNHLTGANTNKPHSKEVRENHVKRENSSANDSESGKVRLRTNLRKLDKIDIITTKGSSISTQNGKNINTYDHKGRNLLNSNSVSITEEMRSQATSGMEKTSTDSKTNEIANSNKFGLSASKFDRVQALAREVTEIRLNYLKSTGTMKEPFDFDAEYEKRLKTLVEMRGGTFEVKTDIGDINIAKVEADLRKELEKDADFMKQNGLDFELVFKGKVYETISKMTGEDYMNLSVDDYLADKTIGGKSRPFYIPDENNPGSYKVVDRDSDEAKSYVNKLIEDRNKANTEYAKYNELKESAIK